MSDLPTSLFVQPSAVLNCPDCASCPECGSADRAVVGWSRIPNYCFGKEDICVVSECRKCFVKYGVHYAPDMVLDFLEDAGLTG